jgi:glutamyl-tRNA reductase
VGADRCPEVVEHVTLSTCYRVELYAALADDVHGARDALVAALADAHDIDSETLVEHLYVHTGEDVARHLSRVATGLDSLVLGEAEVLGQVRDAHESAGASAGPVLELLFRSAITAGRRARSETALGARAGTASTMAISLAEGVLGSLEGKRALVVGAGRIGTQTLRALRSRGVTELALANRTPDRALIPASEHGAATFGLADLGRALAWADLAVTATSSEEAVVGVDAVRSALAERTERPLVLVDLAVPADVEREVGDVEGVSLFDVDDLRVGLDGALASRMREVPKAEEIVEQEVSAFGRRYRELEVEPLVAAFRARAEVIREQELERALARLGERDAETAAELERLSRSLVAKLLHEPTVRLRGRAGEGDVDEVATAVRELFGLPEEP